MIEYIFIFYSTLATSVAMGVLECAYSSTFTQKHIQAQSPAADDSAFFNFVKM